MRGPERLDVGRGAERREPGNVVGVHDLQVRQVVAAAGARSARGGPRTAGGSDRIQGVAHRAVAERVEVHLESLAVERGDVAGELLGIDEVQARLAGGAAVAVQVRLQHRRRVILGDAVQHHLHARGTEPSARRRLPRRPGLALVQQLRQLLQAAVAVPPQRADDGGVQRPRLGGTQVGDHGVCVAVAAADDRVLPAGDAEGEQVILRGQQRPVPVFGGGYGHEPRHQAGGALLQHAHRLAALVLLDPAVGRVRSAGVDARQAQCCAVYPGPMAVSVRQEGGAVPGHRVQRLPGRDAAGERGHRPAAARYPRLVGVLARIGRDDLQVAVRCVGAAQVAAPHLVPGEHRVSMRVDEAGQQRAAVQVDRLGRVWPAGGLQRLRRAHSGDGAPAGPDAGARGKEAAAVEDRPVAEEEFVCIAEPHAPSRRRALPDNSTNSQRCCQ